MEAAAKMKFKTVDEYIGQFTGAALRALKQMRTTIKKAAPQAEEVISYNMPAFKLNGVLVFYAAYKEHIGFYPTPSGILAFKKELSPYEGAKGSVQFPLDEPLPLDLVAKIVQYRVKENLGKSGKKAK